MTTKDDGYEGRMATTKDGWLLRTTMTTTKDGDDAEDLGNDNDDYK